MRVLGIGNMYPPHHFGGYELVWRSAMRHVKASGHEVRVLTTDFDTGTSEPDDPGVHRDLNWYWRDHGFPRMSGLERLKLERRNTRILDRHLAEFEPDVVSWWSMGGMSLSMLERVRRRGLPAVAFVHDDWLDYGRRVDGWYRAFSGRLRWAAPLAERTSGVPTRIDLDHAARFVFVSETTRKRALASGVTPQDTGIAHSGIETNFIGPAAERDWTWSLLYVGRLDERKGVQTAVESLVELPGAAMLTLVGGWDEREEARLRDLAEDHGVGESVIFAGQLSRTEVRAAYDDADVVVFPAVWEEPWGLVPLEAMARGRPVVATGRGGSGEYLRDGENALLFEAGNATELAAAVKRLAEAPNLRDRLRIGGLSTAADHTEEKMNLIALRELEKAAELGSQQALQR